MCRTCGCSESTEEMPPAGVVVPLEQRVLERNDRLAAETRRRCSGPCAATAATSPPSP